MKVWLLGFAAVLVAIVLGWASSQDMAPTSNANADGGKPAHSEQTPAGLVKLFPASEVWLNKKRKAVVVDGQICLREGLLEMFACPRAPKSMNRSSA